MIINCVNCNKKFEVNSSLIPEKGRTIQCGSCNHTWFFNPIIEATPQVLLEKNIIEKIQGSEIKKEKREFINIDDQKKNVKEEDYLSKKNQKEFDNTQVNFSLSKILSYFVVGIISFIALIIVLDTFKSPLSNILPRLELLLYNLFETIKDVVLFIKDLFI
jgi:predicted Zn finger-like uncharacterized protein